MPAAAASRQFRRPRPTSPPVNARRRNRVGTTSGSAPARWRRTSYHPKTANTATEAARLTNVHSGQPASRPCTSGKISRNVASDTSPTPPRSSREAWRARGLREVADGGDDRGDADGQVDQEDHPPARAEQVGGDQPAGEDRAADRRQAHDRAEHPERGAHLRRREHVLDQAEPLRDQDRAEQPLQDPGTDQHLRALGQRAQQRGGDEAARAEDEHALAPVQVAEPAAGDEADRHRERVAGREPLDEALRSPDLGADRRPGDRGDERVEEIHDLRGEDDEEGDPAPAVRGRVGGDGGGCLSGGGGHRSPRTAFVI